MSNTNISKPFPSVEGGYHIFTPEGMVDAVENNIEEFDTTTEGWESEWAFQGNNPAVD